MTPRPLAVFRTDFPDDQIEGEKDAVLLGGRNVALAIFRLVRDGGCEVSRLDYDGLKGWVFVARFKGEMFECLTTSFYPQIFFDIGKQGWRKRETYAEFWAIIDGALRSDVRFGDVRWYRLEDAPDPWPDDPQPRKPADPAAVAAAARELKAQHRRRRNENLAKGCGCWLTAIGLLAAVFGLVGVAVGVARLLGGADHMGGMIANGLVVFVAGGLIFWVFGYVWTGTLRRRPKSTT